MRSLRSLFGEPLDGTDRKPVVAAVVVHVAVARNEEKVERVAVVARVRDGRPVVAGMVERSPVAYQPRVGVGIRCGKVSWLGLRSRTRGPRVRIQHGRAARATSRTRRWRVRKNGLAARSTRHSTTRRWRVGMNGRAGRSTKYPLRHTRVLADVLHRPRIMLRIANQPVVILPLPHLPFSAQNLVDSLRSVALPPMHDLRQILAPRNLQQHMHMVRHYNKSMKHIPFAIKVQEILNHYATAVLATEYARTISCVKHIV